MTSINSDNAVFVHLANLQPCHWSFNLSPYPFLSDSREEDFKFILKSCLSISVRHVQSTQILGRHLHSIIHNQLRENIFWILTNIWHLWKISVHYYLGHCLILLYKKHKWLANIEDPILMGNGDFSYHSFYAFYRYDSYL